MHIKTEANCLMICSTSIDQDPSQGTFPECLLAMLTEDAVSHLSSWMFSRKVEQSLSMSWNYRTKTSQGVHGWLL